MSAFPTKPVPCSRHNVQRLSVLMSGLLICLLLQGSVDAATAEQEEPGVRSAEELVQQGFTPLFDGTTLDGWDVKPWHEGHWVARDGMIDYDGKGEARRFGENSLWTKDSFGDFVLYVEWCLPAEPEMKPQPLVLFNGDFLMQEENPRQRVTRLRLDAGDSGILMRGVLKCQANIWSQVLGSGEINGYRTDRSQPQEVRRACIPIRNADRPLGQWNVFEITLQADHMTVVLNSEKVIDAAQLPDLPPSGPIGLQHHGDRVQFRKVYIQTADKR